MTNFSINFNCAWLLLLIIPAIGVALIPYFRLSKKFRRTRNRITSIVLHSVIMTLCITVLAGMTFTYNVPHEHNEIMLVVDASFSNSDTEEEKNAFVKSVIDRTGSDYEIGVVTFGFNQVYAAELTKDTRNVYKNYLNAERPDDRATDIAAALKFASEQFQSPETAKIVLVTDGIETDGDALSYVRSLAAKGMKIDAFHIDGSKKNEVQISEIIFPEQTIVINEQFTLGLTLQSSFTGSAQITLSDKLEDETVTTTKTVNLSDGIQNVEFDYMFTERGMHEVYFTLESEGDSLTENNLYHSYVYLEVYDDLLIIQSRVGESDRLVEILKDKDLRAASNLPDKEYNVTVVDIDDRRNFPNSLDMLREYDEVVLLNVSNADLQNYVGFDEVLEAYVSDIGGGLFTVGGSEPGDVKTAHAFNRTDMQNTLYQQLLPVRAIDYTPPLGVIIIIDRSGSMSSVLDYAKDGALACLNALSERDYCGIMSLETGYTEEVALVPATQKAPIIDAINKIEIGGATHFAPALEAAGRALRSLTAVEKKHIILVTDGAPNDPGGEDAYLSRISNNYKSGINLSIVGISVSDSDAVKMQEAVNVCTPEDSNESEGTFVRVWNAAADLVEEMRNVLRLPSITEASADEFVPQIKSFSSVVAGVSQDQMPVLEGYYGTKKKDDAVVVLSGGFDVPIYAQWKYGKGSVGSFLCDLNGTWSDEFLKSGSGQRIIDNIINALFPAEDIKEHDISVILKEDNIHNDLSIFPSLHENETVEMTVTGPSESAVEIVKNVDAADGYGTASFYTNEAGLYTILIQRKNAAGEVVSEYKTYKTFSYSAEYNTFVASEQCAKFLENLTANGDGKVIVENWQVFTELSTGVEKTYDPRLPLIIIALVLFIIDIAVRKFKFKWPHELIREYIENRKEKKETTDSN